MKSIFRMFPLRGFFVLILLYFVARSVSAQTTFPSFPPIDVTNSMSRPEIKLSGKEFAIGGKANSIVSFDIISNTAWNISGDGNWLTENEDAVINNKSITLTAISNPRVQKRSVTLTISSPGLTSETITINQAEGTPVLNISAETLIINAGEGSTKSVMITSNTPWTLKCLEQWLSSNTESGDGFRQVVFTATENHGMEGRSAKVTIGVDGLPPKIIEVFQKTKHEE